MFCYLHYNREEQRYQGMAVRLLEITDNEILTLCHQTQRLLVLEEQRINPYKQWLLGHHDK